MEIFWKTIAYYNSSTWLPQIFIVITGVVLTVLLVRKPRRWIKEAMKIYLTALYLWIAVVYYFICCDERTIRLRGFCWQCLSYTLPFRWHAGSLSLP